jgi:hypothetical protein
LPVALQHVLPVVADHELTPFVEAVELDSSNR